MARSDERFKALFKGIPVPTYIWSAAGDEFVLSDYNDAADEMTQGAVGAYLGKSASEMYADQPSIREDMARCRREGRVHRVMDYELRSTGEVRKMNVHYVSVPPDSIMVHAEDVTDREKAAEELRQSEARLANAQRIAHLGNWEWNIVDDTVTWSDEIFRIFGVAAKEFGGDYEAFLSSVHPDDRRMVQDAIERALERREPYSIEHRVVLPSGEERLVHERGEVTFDASGRPLVMSGTVQDLTDRKRVEEALEISERQFREFFHNLTIGAFRSRPDGQIVEVNRALVEMLGYDSAEELQTTNAEDLYVDRGLRRELWEEADDDLDLGKRAFELQRKDGGRVVVLAAAREIRGADGELLYHEGTMVDITDRLEAERALRESEQQFREFFENLGVGAYRTTPSGELLSANRTLARMLGFDAVEELLLENSRDHYVDLSEREQWQQRLEEDASVTDLEISLRGRDGRIISALGSSRLLRGADGEPLYYEGTLVDISAHKKLEAQLRQSQKMEAVGLLAGGIAHDFNNLLTGLIGYTDLALGRLEDGSAGDGAEVGDRIRRDLQEVREAADRAARLTNQLLAFSRQQVLHPQVVDLNQVVRDIEGLLRRTIGEDVELLLDLEADLGAVKVDPGQMGQVLLNLVINAREAMPRGGEVRIETSEVDLDQEFGGQEFEIEPGPYVCLAVSDQGGGMDEETRRRALEPFFTTKRVGEGSGLGLSMVYGIVKQSKGYIRLESRVGEGTAVEICLPRSDEPVASAPERSTEAPATERGRGTILLVEDDELVRQLTTRTLEDSGYEVLPAATPVDAMDLFDREGERIDLVVTDIVMPKLSGPELVEQIGAGGRRVKVLYISGHASERIRQRGAIDLERRFLAKPFTPGELVSKVQEVLLDGDGAVPSATDRRS